MPIWADKKIKYYAKHYGTIGPYDENCINPASINLKLSKYFRRPHPIWQTVDIYSLTAKQIKSMPQWGEVEEMTADGLILYPHDFILAATLEEVFIPPGAAARLMLRSSAGRMGVNHVTAMFGDPAFTGTWTLELFNVSNAWPVVLEPEMQIIQMLIEDLTSLPERTYQQTGRYNHQRLPTPAIRPETVYTK